MTLQDRATARIQRRVLIGWLDFDVDPVFGWTGPGPLSLSGTGDPILDGNVFLPVGGAAEISAAKNDMGSGGPVTITYSAHELAAEATRQIVRDGRTWRLRKAKIWQAWLMDDEKTLFPEIEQYTSGVMVAASTTRQPGSPATIEITIDRDLRFAGDAALRATDHARENAGDTFSSFIVALASKQIAGAAAPAAAPPVLIRGGGGFRSANFVNRFLR